MRRPAFTLIETLITIALLVMLAAVVLPNLAPRIAERRFRDAQQRVELAAVMCRAEAMRAGEARVLVAREDADGVWRFYAEPLTPESAESSYPMQPDRLDIEAPEFEPAREPLLELPEGCSITDELPQTDADELLEPFEELQPELPDLADAGFVEPESEPAPSFVLAAFLPDGRAVTPAELYLLGPGERAATIRIGVWTGAAHVEPIAPEPDADAFGELADLTPPAESGR